ncbi:MAG: hypothetical protein WCA21_06575 [Terracidiphilus sp.]
MQFGIKQSGKPLIQIVKSAPMVERRSLADYDEASNVILLGPPD